MQRQDSAHRLFLINFDIYNKLLECEQDVETATVYSLFSVGLQESAYQCTHCAFSLI